MESFVSSPKCSSEFKGIIFVRYLDHVAYNRSLALVMQPQIREAIGWLVYECDQYVTMAFDRDAMPPTLKGGDPKASGLVILRSDIVEFKRLDECLNSENNQLGKRVCVSKQRNEKLSPKSSKGKGQKQ